MVRRAAQDGFKQTDGFLCKAIAGKEIDVGEGLGNKFLRLIVKLAAGSIAGGLGFDFMRFRFPFRSELGSGGAFLPCPPPVPLPPSPAAELPPHHRSPLAHASVRLALPGT